MAFAGANHVWMLRLTGAAGAMHTHPTTSTIQLSIIAAAAAAAPGYSAPALPHGKVSVVGAGRPSRSNSTEAPSLASMHSTAVAMTVVVVTLMACVGWFGRATAVGIRAIAPSLRGWL